MERPIGDIFKARGVYVMVVQKHGCDGCIFYDHICIDIMPIRGQCIREYRKDGKPVIFVPVEDL